ncbi:MAG: 16S rRNA (cytidine(1402)-2'-O)-methyltransferase [Acidobacteriota bacterium]
MIPSARAASYIYFSVSLSGFAINFMLYVIATPIGNLEDITMRALRLLGEVDLIACEDTRHTRKLLTHYHIQTPSISYHEHNERERTAEILQKLKSGMRVALVSDAGTPLVSDPGFRLVSEAAAAGIEIVPIPGACALITALSASGVASNDFFFAGFLPVKRTARRARLTELAGLHTTLIFYEAPHRIQAMLADAFEILGNRASVLARELTKLHEEFLRGTLGEILATAKAADLKGEIVLLVAPPTVNEKSSRQGETLSILQEVERLMATENLDQKAALKRIARERGIGKSEAYRLLIAEKQTRQ